MTFSGPIEKIKQDIGKMLESINVATSNSISIDLCFYQNGRELLLINRDNPHNPVNNISQNLIPEISDNTLFLIDSEIYSILVNGRAPSVLTKTAKTSMHNIESAANSKTKKAITKTAKETTKTKRVGESPLSYDDGLFFIEQYSTDAERLKRPGALAIKQLSTNEYLAFYRGTVYDKGSDTTFRHYLTTQPGTLVGYVYFSKVANLRSLFLSNGSALRKNGNNLLSFSQAKSIIDTLRNVKVY